VLLKLLLNVPEELLDKLAEELKEPDVSLPRKQNISQKSDPSDLREEPEETEN
jgi:hypothetical protein